MIHTPEFDSTFYSLVTLLHTAAVAQKYAPLEQGLYNVEVSSQSVLLRNGNLAFKIPHAKFSSTLLSVLNSLESSAYQVGVGQTQGVQMEAKVREDGEHFCSPLFLGFETSSFVLALQFTSQDSLHVDFSYLEAFVHRTLGTVAMRQGRGVEFRLGWVSEAQLRATGKRLSAEHNAATDAAEAQSCKNASVASPPSFDFNPEVKAMPIPPNQDAMSFFLGYPVSRAGTPLQ